MSNSNNVFIPNTSILKLERLVAQIKKEMAIAPKHPDQPRFAEICADGETFDVGAAIPILLDDQLSNDVFKNILFAAFCGWVLEPFDTLLVDHFIGIEIRRNIVRSENVFETDAEGYSDGMDIIVRYILAGDDFQSDIVYPFGGGQADFHIGGEVDLERMIELDKHAIQTISYCLQLLDNMKAYFVNDETHSISKNRIFEYLRQVKILRNSNYPIKVETPSYLQSKSTINRFWTRNKESLAFIYAAENVKVSRSQTLLETILLGQVDPSKASTLMPEWAGKAVYFYQNCLKPLKDAGASKLLELASDLAQPIAFKPQKLSEPEILAARNALSKSIESDT